MSEHTRPQEVALVAAILLSGSPWADQPDHRRNMSTLTHGQHAIISARYLIELAESAQVKDV